MLDDSLSPKDCVVFDLAFARLASGPEDVVGLAEALRAELLESELLADVLLGDAETDEVDEETLVELLVDEHFEFGAQVVEGPGLVLQHGLTLGRVVEVLGIGALPVGLPGRCGPTAQLGDGVIEFKRPSHGLDQVVGFRRIKQFMREELIPGFLSAGDESLSGAAVGGPIGGGKTFICEAVASELGIPVITLKNIRSMVDIPWIAPVGSQCEMVNVSKERKSSKK